MTSSIPEPARSAALLAVPVLAARLRSRHPSCKADLRLCAFFRCCCAGSDEKKKDTRETRRTPALRNKVYEKLAEAQAAGRGQGYELPLSQGPQRHDRVRRQEGAEQLRAGQRLQPVGLYPLHPGRLSPRPCRLTRTSSRQPDIPLAMEINTRFTIAQLYFVQEQWQKGIDALLKWFKMTDSPMPTHTCCWPRAITS